MRRNKKKFLEFFAFCAIAAAAAIPMTNQPAAGATAAEIDRGVDAALEKLYAKSPAAVKLSKEAVGVLVFPGIYKAGFLIGGQYGEGALRKGSRTAGYYSTVAGSYGLQIGAQKFGYALFFMSEDALAYLDKSDGWEIGVGPSIVVVDAGTARTLTTTTMKDAIYAIIFDQKGLMGGIGLQGTKISKKEMK